MLRIPQDKQGRDVLCVGVTGCRMEVKDSSWGQSLEGAVIPPAPFLSYRDPGPPARPTSAPWHLMGEAGCNSCHPPTSPRCCATSLWSLAVLQGHWGGLGAGVWMQVSHPPGQQEATPLFALSTKLRGTCTKRSLFPPPGDDSWFGFIESLLQYPW